MKKSKIIILVACFISMLFIIQPVFAINASSSNYSIGMFGTGMATSNSSSSTSYEADSLSQPQGTTRNAESGNYLSNIGFFDGTPYYRVVSINSYSVYPRDAETPANISFYISAVNYEDLWANITRPDGTVDRVELINKGYAYYTASALGRYNLTLYANGTLGTISSVIDYFLVEEATYVPPVTPPSGGGGIRTIIEECNYLWDCTPWSVCSEGKQTRECKNIGTCNGTESKPIEIMNCSSALFDIALKLEDITLNENRNLIFNTNLTEKVGVNKIDVYIKYSIIKHSEGYEIFSQIETKAIQGSMYFRKEINEIQLADGEYTLRVDIIYENLQKAFTEQKFNVLDGKIVTEAPVEEEGFFEKLGYETIFLIVLLIVVLGVVLILFLIARLLKRRGKDDGDSIEKNLREGERAIKMKDFVSAKSIYENLRRIYVPRKDPKKEIYNRIKEFYNKILKSKALMISVGVGLSIVLLQFLFSSNVFEKVKLTGNVINLGGGNGRLIFILIFSVLLIFILIFLFWKRIKKLFKKEPPENTISSLIGKKVYSSDGYLIAEVNEVILEKKKIHSLKITLDKKHKARKKGIVVEYKNVNSIKNVVIIAEGVLSHLD